MAELVAQAAGAGRSAVARFATDPRHLQILSLVSLLAVTQIWLDFQASAWQCAAAVTAALATQWAGDRWLARRPFEPRSALISSLSLCILLRAGDVWLFALAGLIAIGSKYVIRLRGRHIFNPANLAIVVLLLAAAPDVWISPGQWGRPVWLIFLMACLAVGVLGSARRADISIAFLAAYAGALTVRALWLGDPLVIPLHHLQSGAVLVFAFFMISDPKTSPAARTGRILFATAVAALAVWLQFGLQMREGLLYALVLLCPAVPLIDRVFRADAFQWTSSDARLTVKEARS